MSETFTTYGIGPGKYADELQALRDERDRLRKALEDIRDSIGNGALNVNWIKQYAEAALTPAAKGGDDD